MSLHRRIELGWTRSMSETSLRVKSLRDTDASSGVSDELSSAITSPCPTMDKLS